MLLYLKAIEIKLTISTYELSSYHIMLESLTFRYGGDLIDLIYIIDPKKYREFLEKGFSKYLLKLLTPEYRPKNLHDIIIEDKIVGHIYGINLKALNTSEGKSIEEYISKIEEVIEYDYSSIYIEEDLPLDIIKIIENRLNVDKSDCMDIRLFNISYIIDALMSNKKPDIIKEEILIISNKKEEVLKIIDSLSNKLSFISVLGLDDIDGENVYEEILHNIGISIYFPQSKNISLKRYWLIINTLDDLSMEAIDIKNKAIIIDFSSTKPFKGANRYVIEDLSIDIRDLGLVDNPWIGKEVDLNLYGSLFGNECRKFCRILNNGAYITIDNFANQGIKIKGGI